MDKFELTILAAVLEGQEEAEGAGIITPERLREALTSGPGLTLEEKHLIWTSPDVRETYFAVRQAVDLEMEADLLESGFGEEVWLKAASGESDFSTIDGKGFTVLVFRDQVGDTVEWSISLQIHEELRSKLNPQTTVRLVDGGGMIWAEGMPESGQISAIWPVGHETPDERATKFGLRLAV